MRRQCNPSVDAISSLNIFRNRHLLVRKKLWQNHWTYCNFCRFLSLGTLRAATSPVYLYRLWRDEITLCPTGCVSEIIRLVSYFWPRLTPDVSRLFDQCKKSLSQFTLVQNVAGSKVVQIMTFFYSVLCTYMCVCSGWFPLLFIIKKDFTVQCHTQCD